MYENLEEAIIRKRFMPTPRPLTNSKMQDHYAVEPWEKNTLEIDIKDQDISRQAKTFYHTPLIKKHQKQYSTQRGFSFRNEEQSRALTKPKSLAEVSRKSVVNAYNISGNILGQGFSSQRSMPFQLPSKRTKSFRAKQKQCIDKCDDKDPIPARQTVTAMKRRISLQRQQQSSGFIQLSVENHEEFPQIELNRKRSKVISLGYQKLVASKGFAKQKSLQLAVRGALV